MSREKSLSVRKYDPKPRNEYVKFGAWKPTTYEKEVCSRCIYSDGVKGQNGRYCLHILRHAKNHSEATEHRRPCKYNECVKCGVWEPKKKVRPDTVARIREKYKNGDIL